MDLEEVRSRTLFFRTRRELRTWFENNHATAQEQWIGYPKKGSALKGMGYEEVVEEALCFGWVDGQVRSLGPDAVANRYTPRRAGSRWSQVNVDRARRLIEEGRMTDAGRAVFERRTGDLAGYSYEDRPTELDPVLRRKLDRDARAREFFDAQPPFYRKTVSFWVMSAVRDATRERRFSILLKASRGGRRVDLLSPGR